ncbi:SUMO-interacting motif-containing protein 1 isoform X2 [Eublepharis macularius]|uniref:SUMO-interacting motif-containing protein 1 isoform X2 n=1 Tax=Eublepharis macularius TaxID=481883 RepID=A0AA97J708_EUBMA|nr:SUMO-interacting motif-containing protein 1 isoform X2 [Eublepharis macularius]
MKLLGRLMANLSFLLCKVPKEVIDLTGDDLVGKTAAYCDFDIIDLTQPEETMISPLHSGGYVSLGLMHSTPAGIQPTYSPKILTTLDPEGTLDMSLGLWDKKQPSPKEDAMKQTCFQGSFALLSDYGEDSESSHTTYNSDLGSLGSPLLGSDAFSLSSANDSCEHEAFWDPVEDDPNSCPPEGDLNPQLSLHHQKCSSSSPSSSCPENVTTSLTEADQVLIETENSTPAAIKPDLQESTQQFDIKVWMKTLQYFPGVPVHHPFLQNVVPEKDARQNSQQKAQPIPSRRLSMVSSTIEENFFRGTLDFLMDYVSSQYYPPKEITSCMVRQILLSSEVQQEIQKDAYMLLMKIQALHPAKADSVAWDWDLLREVMTEQGKKFPGRLLFLHYVIQTLEDDFQTTARTSDLNKSIAKKVLSCDQCFSNVKELITWVVAAVTGTRFYQHRDLQDTDPLSETSMAQTSISVSELPLAQTAQIEDTALQFQSQKEVMLLQRMLSIAVEVDKSPYCSASKIAEVVFSQNIPKRCQREAFLSSMECHLLRCKVLDLFFDRNCKESINLPLSMAKILQFLINFYPRMKYQDNEATWQRWDEMLHQLNLLVLSYHRTILGHLWKSMSERIKLIIKDAKPKLQSYDSITISDADDSINKFQKQLLKTLKQPLPSPIKEKIDLLRVLFHTITDIYRTFGHFDGLLASGSS